MSLDLNRILKMKIVKKSVAISASLSIHNVQTTGTQHMSKVKPVSKQRKIAESPFKPVAVQGFNTFKETISGYD